MRRYVSTLVEESLKFIQNELSMRHVDMDFDYYQNPIINSINYENKNILFEETNKDNVKKSSPFSNHYIDLIKSLWLHFGLHFHSNLI